MRAALAVLGLVFATGLAACTDRPQAQGQRVVGDPASKGTGSQFMNRDWKPGDERSWDEHMRARAAYGQNEYSRSAGR